MAWLPPAMAFYLDAGASSKRNAVPHTALPMPARIWAALAHLCLGPPPACSVDGVALPMWRLTGRLLFGGDVVRQLRAHQLVVQNVMAHPVR